MFPVDIVRAAQDAKSTWGKVFVQNIDNPSQYLSNWALIKSFLQFEDSSVVDELEE